MSQSSLSFSDLNLKEALVRSLNHLNFEKPTPIQEQSIPALIEGKDIMGLAQTGTGKTAAFSLPILNAITTEPHVQALILAPTRELAIQVASHIEVLAKFIPRIQKTVLCGGQEYRTQLKNLKSGSQIVVGTPGRILDHIERGTLKLNQLKTFVLDEADEMLRMGFIEDVETILAQLPEKKQMALFSATMPSRIRQITKKYLNNPVNVEIKEQTATVKNITQQFLFASQHQKSEALLRVLAVENHQGVIVFTRTKSGADEVSALLQQHNHQAVAIHGDLSQPMRERIIEQFRKGGLNILVATDVAARGLDVERVTHVINYDIAQDSETYVHRIGRTGRAGRSGKTILFLTPKEGRLLNMIERHTKQRIEKINMPSDKMILKAHKANFFAGISERLSNENIQEYVSLLNDFCSETDASPIEVAAALALKLNHDKSWKNTIAMPDASISTKAGRKGKDEHTFVKSGRHQRKEVDAGGQEVFRIDVGRVHGVKPGNIVGAIANEAGLKSKHITQLKIHNDYSTVCLPKGMPKDVFQQLTKAWVCGRQLNLSKYRAA
tara:strand:- start:769 stop:2427 length:1659 start_codon:yes stop_codon:yes gene_type:complete